MLLPFSATLDHSLSRFAGMPERQQRLAAYEFRGTKKPPLALDQRRLLRGYDPGGVAGGTLNYYRKMVAYELLRKLHERHGPIHRQPRSIFRVFWEWERSRSESELSMGPPRL